ncbi:TorD/DmsD family molecular chaperone [Candidatus Litorirhabdus singularis]|uniref:TorD/DmsD family molecular chaperone n=1 Tax=Candidatus Litorirhabdus singularis TaxID=2518993 RepID=UPI002432B231|nr:molecular chaperone TorD family protein [Candidatus Litorirhabdus singularis]
MTSASLMDLAERAPIYAWLARLLVCEIDAEAWRQLGTARDVLVQLEPALADELAGQLTPSRCEDLAEEFARLFLLPNGVSPFASSWIAENQASESIRDEISMMVGQGLLALGHQAVHREPWGRLPQDHVAVLLDLVASAQLSNDATANEIAGHLDQQLLGAWLLAFGSALAQSSREPLYRALGQLTVELHTVSPQ